MVRIGRVTLAKSAGFCFGVNRAVKLIEELLSQGKSVCTLGPLIHNPQYVAQLESRGVRVIDSPEQAPKGSVVVIRSHGVPAGVYGRLEKIGAPVADATCPRVARIHSIVREQSLAGAQILIAGDPEHPEVKGICGYCDGPCSVFRDIAGLREITRRSREIRDKKTAVVVQTTFDTRQWSICNDFIKKVYTNAIIFDTICSATSIRRREAKELAENSDIMLVVGGRQSSNTAKLYSVCAELCPSYLIESAAELPFDKLKRDARVGVTAGASTPACIIKEVLNVMADMDNDENENFDFAAAIEKSFKMINVDDRVRGVVTEVEPNEIQVDLGTKHAGYVPLSELTNNTSLKPDQIVKVGDEIDLVVLRVNDQDGTVMLSKRRIDAFKNWDEIVKAEEEGTVVEGTITDVIKGGLLASVKGVKVFIPASQSGVPRSGNLETLLHKTEKMKIIEVNEGRRRAVGSIRAILKEERKELAEKFWSEVEVGKEYTGKVKSLTSYGAFVDLGGVDGMIHVSELSWTRIRHPSEVVNVGDTVNVIVKAFDPEKKRVSLTYKDKGENPWNIFKREYNVGDIIDAKIVNFMPFGAFAQIIPGVDGLIHISQISDTHIAKPQDVLEMGQTVKAKIIEVEDERKRISLSMKDVPADGEPSDDQIGENEEAKPEDNKNDADELGENA